MIFNILIFYFFRNISKEDILEINSFRKNSDDSFIEDRESNYSNEIEDEVENINIEMEYFYEDYEKFEGKVRKKFDADLEKFKKKYNSGNIQDVLEAWKIKEFYEICKYYEDFDLRKFKRFFMNKIKVKKEDYIRIVKKDEDENKDDEGEQMIGKI